jgi:hypothetical protein
VGHTSAAGSSEVSTRRLKFAARASVAGQQGAAVRQWQHCKIQNFWQFTKSASREPLTGSLGSHWLLHQHSTCITVNMHHKSNQDPAHLTKLKGINCPAIPLYADGNAQQ